MQVTQNKRVKGAFGRRAKRFSQYELCDIVQLLEKEWVVTSTSTMFSNSAKDTITLTNRKGYAVTITRSEWNDANAMNGKG